MGKLVSPANGLYSRPNTPMGLPKRTHTNTHTFVYGNIGPSQPPIVKNSLLTAQETFTARMARALRENSPPGYTPIDLTIGMPDGEPPKKFKKAEAKFATKKKMHQYTPMQLQGEDGNKILAWVNKRFNTNVLPANVVPYAGSQQAISQLLEDVLDPKAGPILLPNPTYPAYSDSANKAGWQVIETPLTEENQYHYDIPALRASIQQSKRDDKAPKVMVIVSPNNPTGAILPKAQLKELTELAREEGILLIYDMAYSEVYPPGSEPPESMMQFLKPDDSLQLIELHTASKGLKLSGSRFAMAIFSPACTMKGEDAEGKPQNSLKEACLINRQTRELKGITLLTQRALATVLTSGKKLKAYFDDSRQEYADRAHYMREELTKLGWEVSGDERHTSPFFLWVKVPHMKGEVPLPSETFVNKVITLTGVGMVPGPAFNQEGYVRIAMTQPKKILKQAISRLKEHFNYS
jgi:LL-diaminopimelate aminotransferase